MTTICITTCMHERPTVTRLWLMRFKRLQEYCKKIGINLTCAAAVTHTDKESAALCTEYGVRFIPHVNKPLGRKWNAAVNFALSTSPDHILICGDDDLISEDYFMLLNILPFTFDRIGVREAYVLDKDRCGIMKFKPSHKRCIGSGLIVSAPALNHRCGVVPVKWLRAAHGNPIDAAPFLNPSVAEILSQREYVEVIGPKVVNLFPDQLNSAMDFNRDISLAAGRIEVQPLMSDTPLITCIKSSNIWTFQHMMQHGQITAPLPPFEVGFATLNEEEQEYYKEHLLK